MSEERKSWVRHLGQLGDVPGVTKVLFESLRVFRDWWLTRDPYLVINENLRSLDTLVGKVSKLDLPPEEGNLISIVWGVVAADVLFRLNPKVFTIPRGQDPEPYLAARTAFFSALGELSNPDVWPELIERIADVSSGGELLASFEAHLVPSSLAKFVSSRVPAGER